MSPDGTAHTDTQYDPTAKLYASPPPSFGHAMLRHFGFAEGYINLNHGSYGSLPTPMLAPLNRLAERIESNPDRFMRVDYTPMLASVRTKLAHMIGAQPDEVVLIPNATHGVNTVVRNLDWGTEDCVVQTSVTYGAVARTLAYVSDTPPHPQVHTFALAFPTTHADILTSFKSFVADLRKKQIASWLSAKSASQATKQTRPRMLVVIDALTSNPGVRLPWEDMVKIVENLERDEVTEFDEKPEGTVRAKAVLTLIDAAHAIGQIEVDVSKSGADFWVSNCHKWLYAKRGCAVMYVPKRNQHLIRTTLPTSFFYLSPKDVKTGTESFVAQFAWTGTHDPVPFLSVEHALNFRSWLGGESAINGYCHALALSGGRLLAKLLGTHMMDESKNAEGVANMVNVSIPLTLPASESINTTLRHELLNSYNCYAAHFWHNGKWWVRCSAQIWNEESDFEYLGKALLRICHKLEDENKVSIV